MARVHTTSKGDRDFTEEEEAQRDIEEAAELSAKPLLEWEAEITATDAGMPRVVEDIIGVLSKSQWNSLSQITRDKYDAKKALRTRMP